LVIGGEYCANDEVYIIRVADGKSVKVKKTDLKRDDFSLQFDCEGDV